MRQIKVRAWDKIRNKMISWTIIKSQVYNVIRNEGNWLLLLYSTLKDHMGIEIYENDIVKITWHTAAIKYRQVEFINGCFMVGSITNKRIPMYQLMTNDDYCSIEVIGNIYENPELLEESN